MPPVRAAVRAALILLPVAAGLMLPRPAQAAPSASFQFTPATPLTSELVTFKSTSTGFAGPQTWDLDGDGNCNDATGASVQTSFPVAGVHPVKLCVTDGIDDATATRRVTVLNRAPIASFTYVPAAPLAGDPIALISTAADPDGPIVAQAWDLDGDGAFDDAAGPTASVTFAKAGGHLVRLLVVDRDGATGVAVATLTVGERPLGLLASFSVVRLSGRVTPRGTRVRALTVDVPPGSRVRVRCHGRGCPFRTVRKVARVSRLLEVHRLRGRLLRPRAVVKVWVTKAGNIGKYVRFRIRRGKPPARADRCVKPGVRRPIRCPVPTTPAGARRSPS